jgi:hypothetical protein
MILPIANFPRALRPNTNGLDRSFMSWFAIPRARYSRGKADWPFRWNQASVPRGRQKSRRCNASRSDRKEWKERPGAAPVQLSDTPRSQTRGQIKHRFAITTEAVASNQEQIIIGRGSIWHLVVATCILSVVAGILRVPAWNTVTAVSMLVGGELVYLLSCAIAGQVCRYDFGRSFSTR